MHRWYDLTKDQRIWKELYMRDFGGEKSSDCSWEQSEMMCYRKMMTLPTDTKKLTWAIRGGHTSLVKILVESNTSLIFISSKKRIPLYVAAQTGNE